jgi:germination protein M
MMNRPIANLTNRLKMSRRWRPKPSHRLLKMLRLQDGPTEKVRNYVIYLVEIADNGDIAVVPRERSVNFVDSPLTRTIQTLIDQPAESEGGSIRNLIPEGSSLNRIWIEGGVAYFDLNEQFRFNPMGMEGHRLQLEQFVRTATQFPTVDAVQFLIDGQAG